MMGIMLVSSKVHIVSSVIPWKFSFPARVKAYITGRLLLSAPLE